MASAMVAGSSPDAVRAALAGCNFGILLGLGNTEINNAGGTAAGLTSQMNALAQVAGGSPDAVAAVNRAWVLAVNAGVDLASTTTTTNLRATYTALDGTLTSTSTSGGFFGA